MCCRHCGREVHDDAIYCVHCGRSLTNSRSARPEYRGDSQKGLGVILSLFLGLIGLIIGLFSFPSGTNDRKTFMSGWWTGLFIKVIVSLISILLVSTCTTCALLDSVPFYLNP